VLREISRFFSRLLAYRTKDHPHWPARAGATRANCFRDQTTETP